MAGILQKWRVGSYMNFMYSHPPVLETAPLVKTKQLFLDDQ
jgi:hypothetical protein